MELEDLKNIWKQHKPGYLPKGEVEIASMLKGSSQSIINKLKRSVWFELIFTIVVSGFLLLYALTIPAGALKWTSISILVMCMAYTFYYIKKITLLNKFDQRSENIKDNLISLIDNLDGYLRFYKRSYTILYPVYFCLGLLFGGLERGTDVFIENLLRPKTLIYLSFVAILFFAISTWFTTWYLKSLYGKHLEKLKKLLDDISE